MPEFIYLIRNNLSSCASNQALEAWLRLGGAVSGLILLLPDKNNCFCKSHCKVDK